MTTQRPLIIGYEDTAEGRDALALGAQLAEALDARPLIATVVVLPKGVLTVGAPTAPLTAEAAGALAEPLEQLALGAGGRGARRKLRCPGAERACGEPHSRGGSGRLE